MNEFIELTNKILYRCKIQCTLYLTKKGQLRCWDDEEKRAQKGFNNKILIGLKTLEWVSHAIQPCNDGLFPKTSKEEMQIFLNLRDEAIEQLVREKKVNSSKSTTPLNKNLQYIRFYDIIVLQSGSTVLF